MDLAQRLALQGCGLQHACSEANTRGCGRCASPLSAAQRTSHHPSCLISACQHTLSPDGQLDTVKAGTGTQQLSIRPCSNPFGRIRKPVLVAETALLTSCKCGCCTRPDTQHKGYILLVFWQMVNGHSRQVFRPELYEEARHSSHVLLQHTQAFLWADFKGSAGPMHDIAASAMPACRC